jgi:hypothetical protein
MSVTYKIDANTGTVRTRCLGRVTMHEVINHFKTLQQDPDCPDRLDVLLDLSEVDSLPETGQLSTVVSEVRRLRSQLRFGACAIVAHRDAVFGMMRVFEVMAQECFRVTCTFRLADEAEAWLISQQSLADQKCGRAG